MLTHTVNLSVVNHNNLLRELMTGFFSLQKNINVTIESPNTIDLIEKIRESPIDILLLDLLTPKLSSIDIIPLIQQEFPNIKIIVVSMYTDMHTVISLLDLGIFAYLSNEEGTQHLLQAVIAASQNRIYKNQLYTEALYLNRENMARNKISEPTVILEEREQKIIRLLWEEKSNKEIASAIFLSISSVEKIKQELKERIGVRSVAGLFKYALRQGIIAIPATTVSKSNVVSIRQAR